MRIVDPQDPAHTYASVLDALPVVAFMANPAGTIVYLSRGWERTTGNSARQVLEQGYGAVVHPDDREAVSATWNAARAKGEPYRDDFRLRFADGSYRYMLSQADPMRGPAGTVIGWFGTLTDIHDLRLAEERIARALGSSAASAREAETRAEFVERLMDASDDCIKVLDLDARLLSMSPNGQKALAIMNFSSVEGADWREFWAGDDRVAAMAAVEAALAGGRGRFTGYFAVEGRERWWEVTLTPILGPDGNPWRLLGVSRDVTETLLANRALASSEERYRLLGEALPGVTWTATPEGLLDHIGGQSVNSTRLPTEQHLGDRWLSDVHPDERERTRARWQRSVDSGEPYESQFRVRTTDGSYRWLLVRALAQHAADGQLVSWVGMNVDIDDQRRADEAREQFVRLVEASDDLIAFDDAAGKTAYLNEAGRRLLGLGPTEDVRDLNFIDFFMPQDRAFIDAEILPTIERDGRWLGEFRMRHFVTDEPVPLWYNVFSLTDSTGKIVGTATVSRDLRERRRHEIGMRALAETGAAMYGSLDFEGTVENVARAVVQSFASYCIVDVLERSGPTSIGAANGDAAESPLAYEEPARERDARHPVVRAIGNGESTLLATLPDDWLERNGMIVRAGSALHPSGVRSLIIVPIRSGQDDSISGALTCILDARDPRGAYTTEDVRFAQEIAVRAGLAFDHARAYDRERRIAVTLQEASLSRILPRVEGVTLFADYRPGDSEATIGGDWFDAFVLADGRLAITVGDVLGSGLAAAVTMGKVRQAMRSAATLIPTPGAMLDVADHTVRADSAEIYATALAGIYDPKTHEFTFASAGHPGPFSRDARGRTYECLSGGLLLGLRTGDEAETVTLAVPPGTTLVFFTDGLVEATRDIEEGHRRLHAALLGLDTKSAENAASTIIEHVLRGEPATDDVAVLVAHFAPALAP